MNNKGKNAGKTQTEARFWAKDEMNRFLKANATVALTITLSNGARSERLYRIQWDTFFKTCFLFWVGPNESQDPLKNINTEKLLLLVNDPKREATMLAQVGTVA